MIRVPDSGKTTRTTVWAVVVLVLGTLLAVVAISAVAPPGQEVQLVTLVLGVLAPTLAILATMRQVSAVNSKVDQVVSDTHDLTNGLLASSVRAGVADVIHDDLIDPAAKPQLAVDQAIADERHREDTP